MPSNSAAEDEELEAFAELARRALAEGDPPPADASVLARLAFEVRDLPTIEGNVLERDAELAGVRGEAGPDVVQHGDTTLTWTAQRDELQGLIDPPTNVVLEFQTQAEVVSVELNDDGSFVQRFDAGPHRFVVRSSNGDWATPWTT